MSSISTRLQPLNNHIDFFTDESGQPIKFRIQPGFNSALKSRLEDGITLHGGLVISRIPVRGIVVVDPKSRAGRELVSYWAWNERKARHFVSYTYVQQCLDAKKMFSLGKHALQPEVYKHSVSRFSKGQSDIPNDVKDKLALYLATVAPEIASGNRPSNRLYQRLVKNKDRYPWVRDYDWQTLRNYYCKNKKYYGKLISAIVEERGQKAKAISFPRKEFIIATVPNRDTNATVVEAVVPFCKEYTVENIDPITSKKITFDKELLGEHKRSFAIDMTNMGAKIRTIKKLRTIDDMLKEPLPPIIRKRKGVEPRKATDAKKYKANDDTEVEVGRALLDKPQAGVWVDDKFKDHGSLEREYMRIPQKISPHDTLTSQNLSHFQLSLASYGMDFDDLRSSMHLDASNHDSEADLVDEHSVVELLGLSGAAADIGPRQTDSAIIKTATNTSLHQSSVHSSAHNQEDPESITIRQLIHTTQFTQEEIEQKLASFSGDMVKTRSFFERCRLLVDDLFAQSLKTDAGVDTSNNMYAAHSTAPTESVGNGVPPQVQNFKQRMGVGNARLKNGTSHGFCPRQNTPSHQRSLKKKW